MEKTDQGTPTIRSELYAFFSWLVDSKALYVALAASFLLSILLSNSAFGILTALLLLLGLISEIYVGLSRGGLKNELKETAIALAIALLLWFGSSFLLQVPSPLNAVVSCSMLPQLQVGDMILLQGGEVNAPIAQISDSDIAKINDRFAVTASAEGIGTVPVPNGIYSYCTTAIHASEPICALFTTHPELITEIRGPLQFKFEACEKADSTGRHFYVPCTRSVSVNGTTYKANFSDSIIVYGAPKQDLFGSQGDIIHRVILKLQSENGSTYYLTKGDNNPIFDLQAYSSGEVSYSTLGSNSVSGQSASISEGTGNNLVSSTSYKGKMLARLPYLGYFKMFLFGRFSGGEGCTDIYVQ